MRPSKHGKERRQHLTAESSCLRSMKTINLLKIRLTLLNYNLSKNDRFKK